MKPETTTYQQGAELSKLGILPLGYFSWVQGSAPGAPPELMPTHEIKRDFHIEIYEDIKPAFLWHELKKIMHRSGGFPFLPDCTATNLCILLFSRIKEQVYSVDGINKFITLLSQQ